MPLNGKNKDSRPLKGSYPSVLCRKGIHIPLLKPQVGNH